MRVTASILLLSALPLVACGDDIKPEPKPVVTTSSLDFAVVACGTAAPQQVAVLANTGDGSMTFTAELAARGASPFSVTPGTGTVTADGVLELIVTAKPVLLASGTGALTDTLTVTTDAKGDIPHAITLTLPACTAAKATPVLSASTVDFGRVDCGATAPQQAFVLANTGGAPFTYTGALAAGGNSPFLITPATGVLPSNGTLTIFVTPKAIPATSGIAPLTDTLTLTTDAAGDTPHAITLSVTPHGAVITTSAASLAFAGIAKVGIASTPSPLTITNLGNSPATIKVSSLDESFVVNETPATVAVGGNLSRPVTLRPLASGALSGAVAVTVTGPQCGAIPATTMTGTGTFGGTAADVLLVGPAQARKASATMCILLTGGQVTCLGSNQFGARGTGSNAVINTNPLLVRTGVGMVLDQVVQLAGQRSQVCARRTDGSVWCWGNLGGNAAKNGGGVTTPAAVKVIATGATSIAASYGMLCATVSGSLQCFGQRAQNWTVVDVSSWVASGTAVALNACGGYTLQADGSVLSFGANRRGERGSTAVNNSPASPVTGLTNVSQLVGSVTRGNGGGSQCGGGCARLADGTVQCWGSGRHGKNGDGTTLDRSAPVTVTDSLGVPLAGVTQISAGRHHRCAITATGLVCWGRGNDGELGIASASDVSRATPPTVAITDAIAVATEARGTCVVHSDGSVSCFGQSAGVANLSAFTP